MVINFDKSAIPANYLVSLSELTSGLMELATEHVPKVVEVVLMSMSDYARAVKDKSKPVAIVIDDFKGNPILSLKVKFYEGSEEDPDGSWNPVWTFNPEDIADCNVYKVSESQAFQFFKTRAFSAYDMQYTDPTNAYHSALIFANTLKLWLDTSANEAEPASVHMDGMFTATVEVVDGEKVFTFVPEEELSNLIKDDASLQTSTN